MAYGKNNYQGIFYKNIPINCIVKIKGFASKTISKNGTLDAAADGNTSLDFSIFLENCGPDTKMVK